MRRACGRAARLAGTRDRARRAFELAAARRVLRARHRFALGRRHARGRLPRRDRAHPSRPHGRDAQAPCRRARGHRRDPPRAHALLRGARPGAEGEICGDELGRERCAATLRHVSVSSCRSRQQSLLALLGNIRRPRSEQYRNAALQSAGFVLPTFREARSRTRPRILALMVRLRIRLAHTRLRASHPAETQGPRRIMANSASHAQGGEQATEASE